MKERNRKERKVRIVRWKYENIKYSKLEEKRMKYLPYPPIVTPLDLSILKPFHQMWLLWWDSLEIKIVNIYLLIKSWPLIAKFTCWFSGETFLLTVLILAHNSEILLPFSVLKDSNPPSLSMFDFLNKFKLFSGSKNFLSRASYKAKIK